MKLVERAERNPAKCAVTGDIDGPFIDTDADVPVEGHWYRIYLHVPLIEEWAREMGFVDRKDYDAVFERAEELTTEVARLGEQIDEFRQMLRFVQAEPDPVAA